MLGSIPESRFPQALKQLTTAAARFLDKNDELRQVTRALATDLSAKLAQNTVATLSSGERVTIDEDYQSQYEE